MLKTLKRIVLGLGCGAWALAATAQAGPYDANQVNYGEPTAAQAVGGECLSCNAFQPACGCCDDGNWLDNTLLFYAIDSWTNIGDGVNSGTPVGLSRVAANYGMRSGFNTGLALGDSAIRLQVGASYGIYDLKGRDNFIGLGGGSSTVEQQSFYTVGLFKRSNVCAGDRISWGGVYDHMTASAWSAFPQYIRLGQFRGQIGYALSEANEVGVWGTACADKDSANIALPGNVVRIRSVNQVNAFWHHNWERGADTFLSIGASDNRSGWTMGLSGQSPLSDSASLFASTNYYIPGVSTGSAGQTFSIWNVSFGISFSLGGKAVNRTVSGNRGLPLLNVADNGSFGVSL